MGSFAASDPSEHLLAGVIVVCAGRMRGVVTSVWHYIYGIGVAHSGGLSMSWSICDTDMRHQFVISVDNVESKERNYVRLFRPSRILRLCVNVKHILAAYFSVLTLDSFTIPTIS